MLWLHIVTTSCDPLLQGLFSSHFNVALEFVLYTQRTHVSSIFPMSFTVLLLPRSDSVGSLLIHQESRLFWIGRFHIQPISESHIERLKMQPISDLFALMENHVVKLPVASFFCSVFCRPGIGSNSQLISFPRSEAPSWASFWSCRLKYLLSAPFRDRIRRFPTYLSSLFQSES